MQAPRDNARVLHVVDQLREGGVSNVIFDLSLAQIRRGADVEVGVLRSGPWDARARNLGLRVVSAWRWPSAIWSAARVHSHHRRASLATQLMGGQNKLVEHVHNRFTDHNFISFRARSIITVSSEIADTLSQHYSHCAGNLTTIPNGVPIPSEELFEIAPSPAPLTLLGAGRLDVQKNPLRFLEVIAQLLAQGAEVQAIWLGSGALEEAFQSRVKQLNLNHRVSLLPWVSRHDYLRRLRESHYLLMTSDWEGAPLVALEAFSVGRPVISTAVGDVQLWSKLQPGALTVISSEASEAAMTIRASSLDWQAQESAALALHRRYFTSDEMCERVGRVYESMSLRDSESAR